MPSFKNSLLAVCALTAIASAQSFSKTSGGSFVDISPAGNGLGTAIAAVGDDTEHNITTTIGNAFFPAGSVRIGNNGGAIAGVTTGEVALGNVTIAPTGFPAGNAVGGTGYLFPFWDDLDPVPEPSAVTIYVWEDTTANILYIQWNNVGHFPGVANQFVTFQAQVFGGASGLCTPIIRYAYLDTVFGGTQAVANDNGLSATVGYVNGTTNVLWSFNQAKVFGGDVLTLLENPAYNIIPSSPGGPGDLQLDFVGGPCGGGTYILAVTGVPGLFPNGWLYGLDIPIMDLANQVNSGFPFVGPLSAVGTFTLGPFGAGSLPSGFTFYAVGLAYPTGGNGAPTVNTPAFSYTIP